MEEERSDGDDFLFVCLLFCIIGTVNVTSCRLLIDTFLLNCEVSDEADLF